MPALRPNVMLTTLVLEIVWAAIAVAAYNDEVSRVVNSTSVAIAAIGLIWATPAIALCAIAWLIEQGLRGRDMAPPPAPVAPPPPPPAA
jgi:hypothetical protein